MERRKRRILLPIIFLLCFVMGNLFCACQSQTPKQQTLVVAHACGGIDDKVYLNCQEGFNLFLNSGCKYFEVDFAYTSDDVLVCSHRFDHMGDYGLNNRPTFEEFCSTLIDGKYHAITIGWLAERMKENKDIKVVFDAKGNNKMSVLTDVCNRLSERGVKIQNQFIAQMYYKSDYNVLKSLNLYEIWFTNYKVNWTQQQLNKNLADMDISIVIITDDEFRQFNNEGWVLNYKVGVHYGEKEFDKTLLKLHHIDYLYLNYLSEWQQEN